MNEPSKNEDLQGNEEKPDLQVRPDNSAVSEEGKLPELPLESVSEEGEWVEAAVVEEADGSADPAAEKEVADSNEPATREVLDLGISVKPASGNSQELSEAIETEVDDDEVAKSEIEVEAVTSEAGMTARTNDPETPEPTKNINLQPRSWLGERLLKTAVFFSLGILVVGANFWFESNFSNNVEAAGKDGMEQGLAGEASAAKNSTVDNSLLETQNESHTLGLDQAILRFDLNFEKRNDYFSEHSNVWNFDSGRFWGNFEVSDELINLRFQDLVLIPNKAVFDLSFDGEKLDLAVFDGDLYLGLLDEGMDLRMPQTEYSASFYNVLMLSKGAQVILNTDKLSKQLEFLLPSKLRKEFKYSAISSDKKAQEWVKKNLQSDQSFNEKLRQSIRSDVLSNEPVDADGVLGSLLFWAEDNLTFMPGKNREIAFRELFKHLNRAIYHAANGEETESAEAMKDYHSYMEALPEELRQSFEYFIAIDQYLKRLSALSMDQDFRDIYYDLLVSRYEKDDARLLVKRAASDIYEAVDQGNTLFPEALGRYKNFYYAASGDVDDARKYRDFIIYQDLFFDNLFLRDASLYKDEYFAFKDVLEQELLNVEGGGDLREDLVANKITYLKRLRKFFFDDELEIDETKKILTRLVQEIDELMDAAVQELAVSDIFEAELKDIGYLWGYLRSPEYNSSKTYGLTHKDRYEVYLDEEDRIWSFVDIQEEVLGDENVPVENLTDVRQGIKDFFNKNEDVEQIRVVGLHNVNQRYVNVKGNIGGYDFEARFDRSYETLSDVYAYGELLTDSPIKLSALLSLFKEIFAEIEEEGITGDDLALETHAQRVARVYIVESRLPEFGFVLDLEDVELIDKEKSVYRVKGAYLEKYPEVVLDFDYVSRGEIVKNILMRIDGRASVFNEEVNLDRVETVVVEEKLKFENEGKVLRIGPQIFE